MKNDAKKSVYDKAFAQYGRVLSGYELAPLLEAMAKTPLPEDVVYVAGDRELEALSVCEEFSRHFYGGMPIQVGYCNGNNDSLTALEYHRNSEINVAATDMVLILGKQWEVTEDFTYDRSLTESFFVPAGTAVEIYATTLHYAPCNAQPDGFKCTVILPQGTNLPIKEKTVLTKEDTILEAKNKWLIRL